VNTLLTTEQEQAPRYRQSIAASSTAPTHPWVDIVDRIPLRHSTMVPKAFFKVPLPEDVIDTYTPDSDILLPDPDRHLSGDERAAKRRRILEHGNNLLKGQPPILLSTVLRNGPFEGWRNPWKRPVGPDQPVQQVSKRSAKSLHNSHRPGNSYAPSNDTSQEWLRQIPRESSPATPTISSPSEGRRPVRDARSSPPNASLVIRQQSVVEPLKSPHRSDQSCGRLQAESEASPLQQQQRGFQSINAGWITKNPRPARIRARRSVNPVTKSRVVRRSLRSAHSTRGQVLEVSERLVQSSRNENDTAQNHDEADHQPSENATVQQPNGRVDPATPDEISPQKDDWRLVEKWTGRKIPPCVPGENPQHSLGARLRRAMRQSGGVFYGDDETEEYVESTSAPGQSTQPMSTNEIAYASTHPNLPLPLFTSANIIYSHFQKDTRLSAPDRQDSRDYPPSNSNDNQPALLVAQGAFLDLIPPPDEEAGSIGIEGPRRVSDGASITPFQYFDSPLLEDQNILVNSQDLATRLSPLDRSPHLASSKQSSFRIPDGVATSDPRMPCESAAGIHRQRMEKSNGKASPNLPNCGGPRGQSNAVHPESDHSGPLFATDTSMQPAQQVMNEFELNSALDEAGSFLGTWTISNMSTGNGSNGANLRSALKITKP
jgi:hypothetical protein